MRPENCRRICSTGRAKLRIFTSICKEEHKMRLAYEPPQPAVCVRLNDLVVLKEDRECFEDRHYVAQGNIYAMHSEKTAFEVEAALIDAYPEVSNIAGGHYSDDRGVMHSKQIIEIYQAAEFVPQHKLLLITINESALEKDSIYEAVRFAWRLSPKKAQQAEYVLAVRHGVIVGVFRPHQWLAATTENFPGKADREKRWGFIGEDAPSQISDLYLRKRLPDSMRKRGAANPVKYLL